MEPIRSGLTSGWPGLAVSCALLACGEASKESSGSPADSTTDPDPRSDPVLGGGESKDGAASEDRPRLRLYGRRHDFGEVLAGEEALLEVELHNTGDAELEIERVAVGCGCVAAELERDRVPAGETTKLAMTFRSGAGVGDRERIVHIYSNCFKNPHFLLRFDVKVIRRIDLKPEAIDFGDVAFGVGAEVEVEMVSNSSESFSVVRIESGSPELQLVATEQESEAGSRYLVRARLAPEAPLGWPGVKAVQVMAFLEDSVHEKLQIPVTGRVVAPVRHEPDSVDFGLFDADTDQELTIRLVNLRPEQPIAAPTAKIASPANNLLPDLENGGRKQFLVVRVEEVRAGQEWRVVVRREKGYPLRTVSGRLNLFVPGDPSPRALSLVGQLR